MPDVVFVQMPFAGLERPSLALGLLTATLREAGMPTETVYANIVFAEMLDLPAYYFVGQAIPHLLAGDWVFAEAAFGEDARALPDVRWTADDFPLPADLTGAVLAHCHQPDVAALLRSVRRRAVALVDEVASEVVARRPRVVACTSMFDQHVASLALLRRVKELAPDVLTAVGGANCAGTMGTATHRLAPWVDFTITGEFDQYALTFFRALREADGVASAVSPLPPNVLGPADRWGERAAAPAPMALLTDMDRAAVPDYDDYFEQLYASPIGSHVVSSLPFETSRGCWWGAKQHCTFCGLNAEGMAFRKKSAGRAVAEIRSLTARYGISRCFATDNIIDMSYFGSVLPALAKDEREYRIFYETKSNLKREHVQALADAGCYRIQPGIESLHDETLRIMRKGTTACANLQLLKLCLEIGVAPAWSILCNFPGSDPRWVADVARDFPSLFHLPPPMGTVPIRIDRFSPYHQSPEDHGLALEPMPSYARTYPAGPALLADLAYFFEDKHPMPPAVAQGALYSDHMTRLWREEFWSARRAELTLLSDEGGAIRIRDTRAVARTSEHELRGAPAAVLRALATPASRTALGSRLAAQRASLDEDSLCEALDDLLDRRLVWRSSSEYLALPTPPPQRTLHQGHAMGEVQIWKYLRSSRLDWSA